MKKTLLVSILTALILIPSVSLAASEVPGFAKDKGKKIVVEEPLGWNTEVNTTYNVKAIVESLPGMSIVRVKPYRPWYKFFLEMPEEVTIAVDGFEPNTDLYVYTNGYREETIVTTDENGIFEITKPTDESVQMIIKDRPSTIKISKFGVLGFGDPGEECEEVGVWTASNNTCTLTQNVNDTIAIEDEDITLDGQGVYKVLGDGTGDGVYTDEKNVTIKNLDVIGFTRGVVFDDSLINFAVDGSIQNVKSKNNTQGLVIEGVSGTNGSELTLNGNTTGIQIIDQLDGNDTDNISIRESIISNNQTGIFTTTNVVAEFVQNNFISNTTDTNIGGTVSFDNVTDRGNYWSKNTGCTQDAANSDECTNSYLDDDAPWACENAWSTGSPCPFDPPTGGGGDWAEVSTTGGTTILYEEADASSAELKILPNGWAVEVLGNSGNFLSVKDHTDDTNGYILASNLNRDESRETEFEEKAVVNLEDNTNDRKDKILEAVSHYLDNSDTNDSLYSSKNNPNNFTEFESAGIIKELILGIVEEEIGIVNYDNDFVSFDYGHGLGQITTRDSIGEGSKISIPYCENSTRSTCYSETKRVPILNSPGISYDGKDYLNFRYYDNSHQSFYANIKDAFKVIQNKYASAKNFYNLNEIFSSRRTGEEIDGKHARILHTVRGYNSWGECPNILFNEANIDYLENVQKYTERAHTIFSIPTTERSDLEELLNQFDIVSREQQFMHVCSPAYLQVYDQDGNMTGFNGSQVVHEVPLVVYDEENHKQAYVLLDIQELIFRVVGEDVGTYSFPAGTTYLGEDVRFKAIDIPTSEGEIHEYVFDWENGEVIVRIDQDGDGVFEKEFTSDLELTAEEFAQALNKVTICHIPPGKPLNAHEISIGESAVSAHLKHGDVEGSCDSSEAQEAIADKIEERNLAKPPKNKKK